MIFNNCYAKEIWDHRSSFVRASNLKLPVNLLEELKETVSCLDCLYDQAYYCLIHFYKRCVSNGLCSLYCVEDAIHIVWRMLFPDKATYRSSMPELKNIPRTCGGWYSIHAGDDIHQTERLIEAPCRSLKTQKTHPFNRIIERNCRVLCLSKRPSL